jgi:hypothetical protein
MKLKDISVNGIAEMPNIEIKKLMENFAILDEINPTHFGGIPESHRALQFA